MENKNNTSKQPEEKWIVKILRKGAVWIGIVFIGLGLGLGLIPAEELFWINCLTTIVTLCSTFGATFLSVALINFIYEQWRDKEMETKIDAIPDTVKENIKASITQITEYVLSKINPSVPYKIFPPGRQENDPIVDYLKESLSDSDGKYYYMGIEMSTIAKAISELKYNLKEAFFFIPNPNIHRITDDDKANMKESIEAMIKVWESKKDIRLEFIFMHDIPPFHIHKTSKDCWFAFLDIGTKDDLLRQKYPATYQYRKNKDKSDDNYEMYHTISDTINKLYERHRNGMDSEIYIFRKGQEIMMNSKKKKTAIAEITCQKNGKPITAFTKENFINLFTNTECHE